MVSKKGGQIMNIEIANKLVKLRKQAGLSQEELADKLGLSRQAVSKWERAEASPDTDNLICLAKLYGVSLDELLSTEDDAETIIKEQIKKDEDEPKKGKTIDLGDGAIHIETEDGEKVHISGDNIHVIDEDGQEIKISGSGVRYARDKYFDKRNDLYSLFTEAIDHIKTTYLINEDPLEQIYKVLGNYTKYDILDYKLLNEIIVDNLKKIKGKR